MTGPCRWTGSLIGDPARQCPRCGPVQLSAVVSCCRLYPRCCLIWWGLPGARVWLWPGGVLVGPWGSSSGRGVAQARQLPPVRSAPPAGICVPSWDCNWLILSVKGRQRVVPSWCLFSAALLGIVQFGLLCTWLPGVARRVGSGRVGIGGWDLLPVCLVRRALLATCCTAGGLRSPSLQGSALPRSSCTQVPPAPSFPSLPLVVQPLLSAAGGAESPAAALRRIGRWEWRFLGSRGER